MKLVSIESVVETIKARREWIKNNSSYDGPGMGDMRSESLCTGLIAELLELPGRNNNRLLPCKKCGSEAVVDLIGNNNDGHMPICDNADCEHMLEKHDYDTEAEAIHAWNKEMKGEHE